MDDRTIVTQVLEGKTDHFSVLMNRYHNEIFSFVFNMLGQYQDTEDLVQEIFLKVYQSLSKYDSNKASFRTWLYRISSNHTINYINSSYYRHKTSSDVDTSFLEDSTDMEAELIKDEQIKQIIQAMKKRLSKKHQRIMMLHYFSGLTVQEISESTNIPDKTIYKAIKSSIHKIKEEVAQYEQLQ